MLLDRIDVSKSSGPDKLPGRLLQSLAKEITPVVHFIFTHHFALANYLRNGHKLILHLFTGSELPSCISDMYYMQAICAHYL